MNGYYLNPTAAGLPAGLPVLKHQPQADGRLSIFAGETEEFRVWVEPKPVAWTKPGLYATEPPTMPTGHLPITPNAGHKPTNFGVNIQGLKPHENRVETNDPTFMPNLQTNLNSPTAAGQQVPLPLGGDGPGVAIPPYVGIGVGVLIVLAILTRRRATVGS